MNEHKFSENPKYCVFTVLNSFDKVMLEKYIYTQTNTFCVKILDTTYEYVNHLHDVFDLHIALLLCVEFEVSS